MRVRQAPSLRGRKEGRREEKGQEEEEEGGENYRDLKKTCICFASLLQRRWQAGGGVGDAGGKGVSTEKLLNR